jgi:hypothetical protein
LSRFNPVTRLDPNRTTFAATAAIWKHVRREAGILCPRKATASHGRSEPTSMAYWKLGPLGGHSC